MKKVTIFAKILAWGFSFIIVSLISLWMYVVMEDSYGFDVFAHQDIRLSQAEIFWGLVNSRPLDLLEVLYLPIIWLILFIMSFKYKGSWYLIVPILTLFVLSLFI